MNQLKSAVLLRFVLLLTYSIISLEVSANCVGENQSPYPCSDTFSGIEIDWNSHLRRAGHSDNWPMTWASDDAQYTSWGDGFGWIREKGETHTYSLGMTRIEGSEQRLTATDIYHGALHNCLKQTTGFEHNGKLCGKTYGLVALDSDKDGDDELYMWLSPGSGKRNLVQTRLYYSRDFGESWRKTGVSFHRNEGVIMPAFIQFGKSYEAIKETGLDPNYVYFYVIQPTGGNPRTLTIQRPGIVFLMRVHQQKMGSKSAYQYYSGNARSPWSNNRADKIPVFTDPNGVGWNLSVIYLPALKRYILATEHDRSFHAKLGLFESETPWGPWQTIAYYDNWVKQTKAPGSAGGQKSFYWNLSPKWSGKPDATDFSMIYTGIGKPDDSFNLIHGRFIQKNR